MRKLLYAASCTFVLGCAIPACGQTLSFNPSFVSVFPFDSFDLDLQIDSFFNPVVGGTIKFGYDPTVLRLDTIENGPFVMANQGTSSFTSGKGTETITLSFPKGANNYIQGSDLTHMRFTTLSGLIFSPKSTITLPTSNVNLFGFNGQISFGTHNVLILRMEAVPEPGTCTLALALTAGLYVWGIRLRRREAFGSPA